MRIIAGIYKGRILKMPTSDLVRTMTDRVRESLFYYLSNQIDFEGITALDIFSGTGAIGLECLSRGAGFSSFVEMNFNVIKTLNENIVSLKATDKSQIYKADAVRFSTSTASRKYDLIIADPPFFKEEIYKVVKNILSNNFLSEDGLFIVERSIKTISKDVSEFAIEPFKKIGDACLYKFESINQDQIV